MASGTNLVLTFKDSEDKDVIFNYPYADPQVQASSVKALANGIIANSSIFAVAPVSKKSAKLVTTIETPISLED